MLVSSVSVSVINFVFVCIILVFCALSENKKKNVKKKNVKKKKKWSLLFSDTMDKWDQSKLEEVIEKKHGEKEKSMPKTEIVS